MVKALFSSAIVLGLASNNIANAQVYLPTKLKAVSPHQPHNEIIIPERNDSSNEPTYLIKLKSPPLLKRLAKAYNGKFDAAQVDPSKIEAILEVMREERDRVLEKLHVGLKNNTVKLKPKRSYFHT